MSGLTYDAGALLAAERNDRRMWALHRRALERGATPSVPSTVLAQAWRGGPQPLLSALLAGCEVESMDEDVARQVGILLARAATADVVDGHVVATAARQRDAIVTSDHVELEHLAGAARRRLHIIDI